MNHTEQTKSQEVSRGTSANASIRLYAKDWNRCMCIRHMLEDRTGRPHSMTDLVIYLLDCYYSALEDGIEKQPPAGERKHGKAKAGTATDRNNGK